MKIAPVLLAGGNGTRLAPLSQTTMPKQFLQFFSNNQSSFQLTAIRIRHTFRNETIFIATNAIYADIVKQQLSEINETNYTIIAEKEPKNTFPIITSIVKICNKDDVLFFTPTDLIIEDKDKLARQIQTSSMYCYLNQKHILFGIKPTSPEGNFGYIKTKISPTSFKNNTGDDVAYDDIFNTSLFHEVDCFIEKPPIATAKIFYRSNKYYWNSGMFIFNRELLFRNITNYNQSVLNGINIIQKQKEDENLARSQQDYLFTYLKTKQPHQTIKNIQQIDVNYDDNMPSISIDNAIIHNITQDIKCVIADFQWLDFGNWKNFISVLFQNKIILQQTTI